MSDRNTAGDRKPVFVPKNKGLGIADWIIDKIGARPATWKPTLAIFRLILNGSKKMQSPIIGPIYKRLMKFTPEEKTYSHGTIFNLNVDLSEAGESRVLPMDLIKDTLRKAKYIASARTCLCRDALDCKEYPKDLCCFFLSNSGRKIVEHGIGYEISLEDALARVDQAAELGLIGQAMWVEVEQFIWGLANEDMDHFIEICFCCPCCCVGLNLSKNASRDVKQRFRAAGWTAVVDEEKCIGCENCFQPCPQAAITAAIRPDGQAKAVINEEYCVGCGICIHACGENAIKLKQTRPMRASLQEYFLEEGRLNLKLDD